MKNIFKGIKHPSFSETLKETGIILGVSILGSGVLLGLEQAVFAIVRLITGGRI